MSNIPNRYILPVANRCKVCGLPRGVQHEQKSSDTILAPHDWQRDPTAPVWKGWHAFRRGLSTNLQREGAAAATAQAVLRHASVQTTLSHYTKSVRSDAVLALEKHATGIKVPRLGPLQDHSGPTTAFGTLPQKVN
jgi:hypothetical protein